MARHLALLVISLLPPSRSLLARPSLGRLSAVAPRVARLTAQIEDDVPADSTAMGTIVPTVLHREMADSYMAYAMSVIMSRALPDVRDGLKPVHRRILYTMHQLNLQPDGPHRKCARVVGDCLGKYHPHGDSSVYDALVRMAQDFSLRAPLVDGHGNFGSIDPDPAAAMRYTECKLAPLAAEAMLADITEGSVDFTDNFDGSETEPVVLPARLPMLLLNGATGIAVGMATNCPPHNLGELVDGMQLLLADRDVAESELYRAIPAPDFPTGGIVMGTAGARDMYSTGRGSVVIRARAHVEPAMRRGAREAVVVTELPYGVAKNTLLERIAAMVNEKKLEGIADIRDESSMEGVRIVLEIKRDSDPSVVLNNLYKRTPLQTSFAGNLMAVVGAGRLPEQLTLRSALLAFLDFRIECIERRSRGRLTKTEARLHVVDGLLVAQQDMDGVVATVRAADDTAGARAALMSKFGLSQEQSDAILQLQLRRLTALERASLVEEAETLQARRADLQGLLAERSKVLALIGEELAELKSKFDTPRRSQLGSADDADVEDIDLTANEQCIIIRSLKGYVKRMPLAEFEAQNRGTRGKAGANMRDGDAIVQMEQCTTHDTMLCLSDAGVAYALPAYKVPESSRTSRGVLVHQLLPITDQEAIATMLPVRSYSPERYLLLLTRDGWIKKTRWPPSNASPRVASEEQLRASGRQSRGVKSMSMREGDTIADMFVVPRNEAVPKGGEAAEQQLVAVTRLGFGKRLALDHFRAQQRGGKGVIAIKFKRDDDRLLALSPATATDDDELLLITQKGTIVRQRLSAITQQGRATTGVKLQKLDEDDLVASVKVVPAAEEDEEAEDEEATPGASE